MKNMFFILCISFLTACANTHSFIRNSRVEIISLNPKGSVFVAIPDDGAYGNRRYEGSGRNVSQIICSAFLKHCRSVQKANTRETFEESMRSATKGGHKYLVFPTILHWEDRSTEWSGKPDRVEVKIDLVDINSGESLDSVIVKGKSGLATFGGDHPQDLLQIPIEEFVASLYEAGHAQN